MAEKRRSSESEGLERLERLPSRWKGGPFGWMDRFAEEMDRLFDEFGFGGRRSGRWLTPWTSTEHGIWAPQIEAFEREGQFVVRADLPGLRREDVKIEVEEDSIVLQGERRQERQEEREGFYRSERAYGSFYRMIPLPPGVDVEKAKASFRDGVLEVTMPAPKLKERRRRIEIEEEREPARR
ncbi:MAG: Hsp20/alpha crystallin family protein [Acidobacteriota bacterium]